MSNSSFCQCLRCNSIFQGEKDCTCCKSCEDAERIATLEAWKIKAKKVISKVYGTVTLVVRDLVDEGDLVYLGSTNHADWLRSLDEEWAAFKVMGEEPTTLIEERDAWKSRAKAAEAERDAQSEAIRDVIAERKRQVSEEGWTPEHDDQHDRGELARAAGCYARHAGAPHHERKNDGVKTGWPWDGKWWKPTTRRRDLVKACALILAEIERLDRAALLRPEETR